MRCALAARAVAVVLATWLVASCGLLPPSQNQEFAVTGAPPSPPATLFRNADPNINDVEAKAYCVDGYDKLAEATHPTESGTLDVWRVRCTPYSVGLF